MSRHMAPVMLGLTAFPLAAIGIAAYLVVSAGPQMLAVAGAILLLACCMLIAVTVAVVKLSRHDAWLWAQQDSLGGLEARNADEEWIAVPPLAGTFVVNIGDTLQMWTNDLYVSTLHRVVNSSSKARISQPLFTYPHGKTLIECLPTCHSAGNPPKYEPIVCEAYNQALVDQAARTGRPGLSKQTASRFKN